MFQSACLTLFLALATSAISPQFLNTPITKQSPTLNQSIPS